MLGAHRMFNAYDAAVLRGLRDRPYGENEPLRVRSLLLHRLLQLLDHLAGVSATAAAARGRSHRSLQLSLEGRLVRQDSLNKI